MILVREVTSVNWMRAALAPPGAVETWDKKQVAVVIPSGGPDPEPALRLFDQAQQQMNTYRNMEAIRIFGQADQMARQAGLGFMSVMAGNQSALCFNSPQAPIKSLEDALELADQAIATCRELLLAERTRRETAAAILDPHELLREVIAGNLEQFRLREHSRSLRSRREALDDFPSKFDHGEAIARSCLRDAINSFGQTHFWAGIMRGRLARALAASSRVGEALDELRRARAVLSEWCLDEASPLALEYAMLDTIESGARAAAGT